MLYVVPTPIGNLNDITIRALDVLKNVDLIACEDTRTSSILLKHYDISNKLISHHKFNEKATCDEIISKLKQDINIALISDAGTPCISDPGSVLIERCIEEGVEYSVLPGAKCSDSSGCNVEIPANSFAYIGFIDRNAKRKFFAKYENLPMPMVFYESPNRVIDSLNVMFEVYGNRDVSVIREISKLHEDKYHGKLFDAIEHFTVNPPRGEFVIIVGENKEQQIYDFDEIMLIAIQRAKTGEKIKTIAKELSKKYGLDRNEIYKQLSQMEFKKLK